MASPLFDLDELVLKCRGDKAKSYIKEAVSCYKSGAFRSSIVSTWIAVSFDIIDKLKDLTLAGDKEAEKQLEAFEKAVKAGDISSSLKFERDILVIARDKLELLSHLEFIDLERLQQDRNRCAHPSMTSDSEIFNPPAELARVHILSAVQHLLKHPPAQGKYALEYLLKEISSEYFPVDYKKAVVSFENSPLLNARESLVRNLIIVLLKKLLKEDMEYKERSRIIASLKAIEEIHKVVYVQTFSEKLSNLVKTLEDDSLKKTFSLFQSLTDSWDYLDDDVKHKLEAYVERLPKEDLDYLDFLLEHKGLKESAKTKVRRATREELDYPLFFGLPEEVADRIVELFTKSNNFDQANSFASTVTRYSTDFTREQIEKLIKACGKNVQIEYSFVAGTIINEMRKTKKVTDEEVDAWLTEVGLTEYVKTVTVAKND